jgi:hypothetical protein
MNVAGLKDSSKALAARKPAKLMLRHFSQRELPASATANSGDAQYCSRKDILDILTDTWIGSLERVRATCDVRKEIQRSIIWPVTKTVEYVEGITGLSLHRSEAWLDLEASSYLLSRLRNGQIG